MLDLNLPPFAYKLKKEEGKLWIFDIIRKKYVALIPEEWVRQHFIHYLIDHLKYPRALIKVEGGLTFNQLAKRSDIVVFDREGHPWMVVECKSPDLKLGDSAVFQASVYNATLRARYLVVTNGLTHIYTEIHWDTATTVRLDAMPVYS
jgi:hypothetical protein